MLQTLVSLLEASQRMLQTLMSFEAPQRTLQERSRGPWLAVPSAVATPPLPLQSLSRLFQTPLRRRHIQTRAPCLPIHPVLVCPLIQQARPLSHHHTPRPPGPPRQPDAVLIGPPDLLQVASVAPGQPLELLSGHCAGGRCLCEEARLGQLLPGQSRRWRVPWAEEPIGVPLGKCGYGPWAKDLTGNLPVDVLLGWFAEWRGSLAEKPFEPLVGRSAEWCSRGAQVRLGRKRLRATSERKVASRLLRR